jgi:two-component system nitrate/nitrite response regulator NarL
MDRFSIFLTDPDQLVRTGLRRVLAEHACDFAGEARTLRDALVALGSRRVDLLLFDIDGAGESIGAPLQPIRDRGTRTVVLTANQSRTALTTAVSWGVDAYLLKEISPEALYRSLQLVMLGQQIFPAGLLMPAGLPPPETREPAGRGQGLSPREREILECLVDGQSNKEIAQALGIREATVKVHLKALLRKLKAHNRTQAAAWAQRNGFAQQGSPSAAIVA